jgi:hypothetical protein
MAAGLDRSRRASATLRSRWIGAACVVMLVASMASRSSSRADAPAALEAPLDALDPLELARLADRLGDGAVLAALEDPSATPLVRLRAARAARFLDAPEAALAPLAALARGRDPVLAPAAALAAYRVAAALTLAELEAREASVEALAPAREALAALGADESARGDLRRLARFAAAALAALGGAPPAGD